MRHTLLLAMFSDTQVVGALPPAFVADLAVMAASITALELFYAPANTRGQFVEVSNPGDLLPEPTKAPAHVQHHNSPEQSTVCTKESGGMLVAFLPAIVATMLAVVLWFACIRDRSSHTSPVPSYLRDEGPIPLQINPLFSSKDGLKHPSSTGHQNTIVTNPLFQSNEVEDLYGTADDVFDRLYQGRLREASPAM
jgi:hypothetical protein